MKDNWYYSEVTDGYITIWMVVSQTPTLVRLKHISGPIHYRSNSDGTFPFTIQYALITFEPMPILKPIKHLNKHILY